MSPSEQSSAPVILLVEEENDERQAIASHLSQAGFTVLEATDSDEALSILSKRHARVHGLVTDAHVPGKIDGFELAGLTRQRWPELAVVMMSGHSDKTSGPIPENAEFISKSYLTSHLVPTLRRLIGRNA